MDPLVVAGGVGEGVDARLLGGEPFAYGDFLARLVELSGRGILV